MFVQRNTLECTVNSAVIEFNEGPCGINDVLRELGVSPDVLTQQGSNKMVVRRNKSIKQKLSEIRKKRRKKLRSMKKGYADAGKDQEGGESYMSGGH